MNPFSQKTRITFLAVNESGPLARITDRGVLLAELSRLTAEAILGTPSERAVQAELARTVVAFPGDWPAPTDFEAAAAVLGHEAWDAVFRYINRRYGKLKYRPGRNNPVHFLMPDNSFALFQISVRI